MCQEWYVHVSTFKIIFKVKKILCSSDAQPDSLLHNHKKSERVVFLGRNKSKNISNSMLEHFGLIEAVQGLYI